MYHILSQLGIIGFLVGTAIAFFVVMGDLGPPLLAEFTGIEQTANLRLVILTGKRQMTTLYIFLSLISPEKLRKLI